MAIKQCRECDKDVSSEAKLCPHCGAPTKKRVGFWKVTLSVLFCLFILGQISDFARMNNAKRAKARPNSPVKLAELSERWRYFTNEDDLTGKTTYYASLESENSVNFDFPYSGLQKATLIMRTHPQYGKDVLFRIEKGQFLCTSYDGCDVMIRFDDQKPIKFHANEPEDHSSTTLFISNYSRFAGKMLKAKKAFIQATFYNEGSRTFEFNVADFNVKKYRPE